jgi:hypothetical protein
MLVPRPRRRAECVRQGSAEHSFSSRKKRSAAFPCGKSSIPCKVSATVTAVINSALGRCRNHQVRMIAEGEGCVGSGDNVCVQDCDPGNHLNPISRIVPRRGGIFSSTPPNGAKMRRMASPRFSGSASARASPVSSNSHVSRSMERPLRAAQHAQAPFGIFGKPPDGYANHDCNDGTAIIDCTAEKSGIDMRSEIYPSSRAASLA